MIYLRIISSCFLLLSLAAIVVVVNSELRSSGKVLLVICCVALVTFCVGVNTSYVQQYIDLGALGMVEQSPEPAEAASTPEPDPVGDAVTFLNATAATATIRDYLNGKASAEEAAAALVIADEYISSHSESSSRNRFQALLDYIDASEAVKTLRAYVSGAGTSKEAADALEIVNKFILSSYSAS